MTAAKLPSRPFHSEAPMLSFEVPFLPDPAYCELIRANQDRIHSVYFSLESAEIADGRPKHSLASFQETLQGLQGLSGPKKFALLNSRFHCPSKYAGSDVLAAIRQRLLALAEASVLDGIVYADHYMLQALSDEDPGLCSRLEAVPSINLHPGSLEGIQLQLEYIERTAFQPPSMLILDRWLNRCRERLGHLVQQLRAVRPDMAIGLLANEGCLPACPFKPAHDAHISLTTMGCGLQATAASNRDLGCARYFREDPSLMFRSPFIRPDDAGLYDGLVDFLKLSGRTRGAAVMTRVVRHYLQQSYSGNLLELMDTLETMADCFHLPNERLPAGFGERVADCGLNCSSCSYCRDLAADTLERRSVPIKPMWGSSQ
jgi:hypothetical protein